MRMNEYQELAQRTANFELDRTERLAVACLGLCGEAGEVAELVKKHVGHSHDLDRIRVIKELGDVMWYVAETASILGANLEDIAQANIDKLRNRYPQGFSSERSINRAAGNGG